MAIFRKSIHFALLITLLSAISCNPGTNSKNSESEKQKSKANTPANDPGLIQGIRNKVNQTVNANDLNQLRLLIETSSSASGQMPTKEMIVQMLSQEPGAKNLLDAINKGTLLLTGSHQRESIWAYEKDADKNGGNAVTNNGIERLSAMQIQQMLANQR